LVKIAAEFFESRGDLILAQRRNLPLLDYLALPILRRRASAKGERARVFLIFAHEKILNLGATSERQQKQTGRERIQCPAVTDLLDFQPASHESDDVVRRHAFGLIDQQNAVRSYSR
jgi:hypothetical protein